MTVLVTGGSGFVGGAIVERLLQAGHSLRLAQRSPVPAGLRAAGVDHAPVGDLGQPVEWGEILDGVTAVVHVAGLAHQPPGRSDAAVFAVNADATARLARAAKAAGIGHFIFMSSVRAVVGASSPDIIDDDTLPSPVDAYGRSKLAAEQAVAAEGLDGAILRPVLVAGAGAGGNLRLLRKLAGLPLPLPVAGLTGRRSLLSDRSLAFAVEHLLTPELQGLQRCLVAHPDAMTVGGIVTAMRRALGREPGLFAVPTGIFAAAARLAGRQRMLERLAGDLIVRADRLTALGWQPVEPTEQALARLAQRLSGGT